MSASRGQQLSSQATSSEEGCRRGWTAAWVFAAAVASQQSHASVRFRRRRGQGPAGHSGAQPGRGAKPAHFPRVRLFNRNVRLRVQAPPPRGLRCAVRLGAPCSPARQLPPPHPPPPWQPSSPCAPRSRSSGATPRTSRPMRTTSMRCRGRCWFVSCASCRSGARRP